MDPSICVRLAHTQRPRTRNNLHTFIKRCQSNVRLIYIPLAPLLYYPSRDMDPTEIPTSIYQRSYVVRSPKIWPVHATDRRFYRSPLSAQCSAMKASVFCLGTYGMDITKKVKRWEDDFSEPIYYFCRRYVHIQTVSAVLSAHMGNMVWPGTVGNPKLIVRSSLICFKRP